MQNYFTEKTILERDDDMKKCNLTLIFMCVLLLIVFTSTNVFAVQTDNTYVNIEIQKEEVIDNIFREMNDIILEKNKLLKSRLSIDSQTRRIELESRKLSLERSLENLGVHKIDPTNELDIAKLSEVISSPINNRYAASVSPPDVTTLALLYSVYQTTGTCVVDGVTYNYSNVRVVDDKGTGGLTHNEVEVRAIGAKTTVISELLEYNFSFAVSSFLGMIPGGWAAEWTVGNVFAALNGMDDSTVVTSSKPIYVILLSSVTQMTYYYVYIPEYQQWVICGSRASEISISRSDGFAANIGGSSETMTKDFPKEYSSTGRNYLWYIEQFANDRSNHFSPVGYFTITGIDESSFKFYPKYYTTLSGLL